MQEGGSRSQIPGDEGRITRAQFGRDSALAEQTARLVSGAQGSHYVGIPRGLSWIPRTWILSHCDIRYDKTPP